MKRASLYICYYDIGEPLVESQVVSYLKELAGRGYEIHLLTFECRRLRLSEMSEIRERLASIGITWHSRRYHQRPSLPATLYDIAAGIVTAAQICRRNQIELIHARSHVPAAMALALKRLFGYRFLFDYRGMLAEEYVDGGHWKEGELKYRLTKQMERVFFREADAFVMLTDRIKRDLLRDEPELQGRGNEIQIIPCCVDTSRYRFERHVRDTYRAKRGWDDRKVLIYVGKLGLWYLMTEMVEFFATARSLESRLFFQVLTQSDPGPMIAELKRRGVPADSYDIRFEPPDHLPDVLMASDAGISLIRACNSKRASSPTKVGEYLAAGLPVVVNAGVGDSDEMMRQNRLGIVLKGFSKDEVRLGARELLTVLEHSNPGQPCRDYAQNHLSLSEVGGPRYSSLYESLIGTSNVRASDGVIEAA